MHLNLLSFEGLYPTPQFWRKNKNTRPPRVHLIVVCRRFVIPLLPESWLFSSHFLPYPRPCLLPGDIQGLLFQYSPYIVLSGYGGKSFILSALGPPRFFLFVQLSLYLSFHLISPSLSHFIFLSSFAAGPFDLVWLSLIW